MFISWGNSHHMLSESIAYPCDMLTGGQQFKFLCVFAKILDRNSRFLVLSSNFQIKYAIDLLKATNFVLESKNRII